ncbi:diguanylate cyclase [Marinomonas sp. 15G1-11]|uniref:diguanylate cyclase n=1 Tax=Marinomonas phaeophyticola TaxID=3004091 RepID=A0ABT4JRA8_9GAMM|nr:diguanylate cyclase [Marinomonas sp. 15G1-11]MCZ2720780.1 diguanylate cyclase [Marinomonas sp. 15G1-11]
MTETQRVLVIDDEKINLKIISDILRGDVDVTLAKSGSQGIRKAIELKPDLILLDVLMPDMDGFETMAILNRDVRTCAIPVIFITALDDARHEEKGLLLGASDYIQKPFNAEIIRARINLHLQLSQQRKMLERLANIDPLTSLANRRKYQERLFQEWDSALTSKSPLSLVVMDIDDFKQFNDHHGHAEGDKVLQQVARVISSQFQRSIDLVARYGGEEFVALLPNCNKEYAMEVVGSCAKAIENLQHTYHHNDKKYTVTISSGGVTYVPDSSGKVEDLFSAADKMLYLAKQKGKNCVLWTNNDLLTSL